MARRIRLNVFLAAALCIASRVHAYDIHNSLSVDYLLPANGVWERGLGFDAQFGGWFLPRVSCTIGLGTLMLRPLPGAAGLEAASMGQMPSFMAGPSIWTAVPLGRMFAVSAALDGRYAFNPYGPMLYGARADGNGETEESGRRLKVSDGAVARACLHAEALLHASAIAFAGLAWQETLAGFQARADARPLGAFDVDGLMLRFGLRGSW